MTDSSPRHVADVQTRDDDLAAFQIAHDVLLMARDKGFPDPVTTTVRGDRIELGLLWPHLFQWIDLFDGYGQANLPDGHEYGQHRVQMVPGYQRGDFAVYGWTRIDGEGGREQQWVLRPVTEHGCERCLDLPEPARQPLGVQAWRDQTWFELTGRRWEDRKELAR